MAMTTLDPTRPDPKEQDPLTVFNFGVEIQEKVTGYFTEVTGLGATIETTEQKVMGPGNIQIVRKVPGRLKWEDMKLKRAITSNIDMWEWRDEIVKGQVEKARRNGSITMYDQEGTEVARWNFEKAWPSSVTGPTPKADANEAAMEEMTVVYESIYRVK